MLIPDERLDEFRRLYQEEFKEEITLPEAREIISRLLALYSKISELERKKRIPQVDN